MARWSWRCPCSRWPLRGCADAEGAGVRQTVRREVGADEVGRQRPGRLGQSHEELGEHRAGTRHDQAGTRASRSASTTIVRRRPSARAAGRCPSPARRPAGPAATTRYHDELVTTEIGQIQTQFDDPGHIGVNTSKGPFMYNGVMAWDAYEHGAGGRVVGMGPLGVEHVDELGVVCRLVVLDAVADKKSKGQIPANARCCRYPTSPATLGSSPPTTCGASCRCRGSARSPRVIAWRCARARATAGATIATRR